MLPRHSLDVSPYASSSKTESHVAPDTSPVSMSGMATPGFDLHSSFLEVSAGDLLTGGERL